MDQSSVPELLQLIFRDMAKPEVGDPYSSISVVLCSNFDWPIISFVYFILSSGYN